MNSQEISEKPKSQTDAQSAELPDETLGSVAGGTSRLNDELRGSPPWGRKESVLPL